MDRIAYVNHDIEDALRAGRHRRRRTCPRAEVAAPRRDHLRAAQRRWWRTPSRPAQAPTRSASRPRSAWPSCACAGSCSRASTWRPPPAARPSARGAVVQALFGWYLEHPDALPPSPEADPVARVTDFVAGMTDRYALRVYREKLRAQGGPALDQAATARGCGSPVPASGPARASGTWSGGSGAPRRPASSSRERRREITDAGVAPPAQSPSVSRRSTGQDVRSRGRGWPGGGGGRYTRCRCTATRPLSRRAVRHSSGAPHGVQRG